MKKIILSVLIFLGFSSISIVNADYSPTSVPSNGTWAFIGDPSWYFYAQYPGDITSEDLWLWRWGSTYNDIGPTLCDLAYQYAYDNFFDITIITCQSSSFVGAGDWDTFTDANIVQYTAPVLDPCSSYGGYGMSNFVDNIGCQTIENSKLISENSVGQIFFYIIGLIVFIGVAILVVYAFKKFINK